MTNNVKGERVGKKTLLKGVSNKVQKKSWIKYKKL